MSGAGYKPDYWDAVRTGEIDPSDEYEQKLPRFMRMPARDRRIEHGDDFAGDAWLDRETETVVYGAVSVDRNRKEKK